MNIELSFATDSYGRASLTTTFLNKEHSHVLTFVKYGDELWWGKSPVAKEECEYSAFYHHVHDLQKRQVIVTCGSIIQECVIPSGYDPTGSCQAVVEPFVPSIIYSKGVHSLGLILFPKSATKTMRNRIWKLKEAFFKPELMSYVEALSLGRIGYSNKPCPKQEESSEVRERL